MEDITEINGNNLNKKESFSNINQKIFDILDLGKDFSINVLDGMKIYEMFERDYKGYTYNGNENIFDRIKYIDLRSLGKNKDINITVLEQKKIVSILGLEKDPINENRIWLTHVSVDEEYREREISKLLLQKMFEYIKENNYSELEVSIFSPEGKKYLEKNLKLFGKEYPNLYIEDSYGNIIQN